MHQRGRNNNFPSGYQVGNGNIPLIGSDYGEPVADYGAMEPGPDYGAMEPGPDYGAKGHSNPAFQLGMGLDDGDNMMTSQHPPERQSWIGGPPQYQGEMDPRLSRLDLDGQPNPRNGPHNWIDGPHDHPDFDGPPHQYGPQHRRGGPHDHPDFDGPPHQYGPQHRRGGPHDDPDFDGPPHQYGPQHRRGGPQDDPDIDGPPRHYGRPDELSDRQYGDPDLDGPQHRYGPQHDRPYNWKDGPRGDPEFDGPRYKEDRPQSWTGGPQEHPHFDGPPHERGRPQSWTGGPQEHPHFDGPSHERDGPQKYDIDGPEMDPNYETTAHQQEPQWQMNGRPNFDAIDGRDIRPNSAVPPHKRNRREEAAAREELMFRMKMAHLAPGEISWASEIGREADCQQDPEEFLAQVLESLPEFPMSLPEKLHLNRFLQGNQMGQTSQYNRLASAKGRGMSDDGRKRKTARRQKGLSDMVYSDSFGTLGLWDNSIGKVTAFLGTNVASYFKFIRFLVQVNSWSALIMFCFVALPQIIPTVLLDDDVRRGFFGPLSQTIFFYGAYSNSTLDDSAVIYDRPLAYFLTWASIYVLSVVFIVLIMYSTYRRSKQSFSDASYRYSSTALIGWDHSVISNEGCRLKASALTTCIREMKDEDREKRKLTLGEKVILVSVRVVCNVISLGIMGGSGYLIYFVADQSLDSEPEDVKDVTDFFQKYMLTFTVSGLKISIPPILSLLLFFERWQPRTSIKLQLSRTAVFYIASLAVFLISIYKKSTDCSKLNSHHSLSSTTTTTTTIKPDKYYCCWENEVGEQLFQVVILDLVTNIGVGVVMMAGRYFIVKRFHLRKVGNAKINVAGEILNLVYGQALIWLGLYPIPFMALVGFFKFIIQFYFFYLMAIYFCDPPDTVFRASRSGGFFRFILLLTLFMCMLPLAFMIVSLKPSTSCGPFQGRDRVYYVLTERIGQMPDWLGNIFVYVSTPAVVIPVILLLLLLVFYYRVRSNTQRKTARDIRVQFRMQRQMEKRQLFSKNRLQRGLDSDTHRL